MTDMLAIHGEALEECNAIYHEFLGRYKRGKNCIYCFFEGNDDYSFYSGAIDAVLPPGYTVESWSPGNKSKVIKLFYIFDWNRFKHEQILFFVDRDLSAFLNEDTLNEINVYITDNYAIENDIVCKRTCDRLLVEVFNLTQLKKKERDNILKIFDHQHKIFQSKIKKIMIWIIYWKQKGQKPNLNNIMMKDLFNITCGRIRSIPRPKRFKSQIQYIHARCQIKYRAPKKMYETKASYEKAGGEKKFVRGKYELWFLVEFCLSIHKNICDLSSKYTSRPKVATSLGHGDAMAIVGPRAKVPLSLDRFLRNNILKLDLDKSKSLSQA